MEPILCGVDLGGTKLSAGLFDLDGLLLDRIIVYDHIKKTEDMIVEQIALMVKTLLSRNDYVEDELKGVGLGFPGHLIFRDGMTLTTSNLPGFKNYPLRDNLQAYFKAPVIVDNDVNAQAFGEFKFGGAKGYNNMIFLTISTGIGAGIITNRNVFRGQTGTAGECGHTIIDFKSNLQCTCGNFGCWMALAGGISLPKLFKRKIEAGFKSTHPDWNFDYSQVNGEFIKRGLEQGDPVSTAIINDCADYNGIGIYNLFQVFNPAMIMLGGGLTNWGDHFLIRVKAKFHELVKNMLHEPIQIVRSTLGPDAGIMGAAALVLE